MPTRKFVLTQEDLKEIPIECWFKGYTNVRRSNVKIAYTQEQVNEIIKCSKDPIYFIENYIKIVSLDEGLVPFKLYDYQKEMVNLLHNNRFVISKCSRQSGKTAVTCAYIIYYMLFNKNKTIGIVANKGDMALEIMSRISEMYQDIPFWMQQGVRKFAKRSIKLENGSRIVCQATSGSALRGLSINMLYWDETAFVPKTMADDFLASVFPTITTSKNSKVFLSSTPFGYNHFAKFWFDAMEKQNEFVPFSVIWNEVPGRDEKWKKQEISRLGKNKFEQEHECKFLGSAGTLLDSSALESLFHKNPISTHYNNDMKIYEEPQKGHVYGVAVDTGEGKDQDFHAINVLDLTDVPYKQVATYRNNTLSYLIYPDVIRFVVEMYGSKNEIFAVIENNDLGQVIVDTLIYDMEMDLLTFNSSVTELGLRTSVKTKRIGCSTLKSLIEDGKLLINDYDTITELFNFIEKGKSYKADEGHTDDLVMGLVIFAYVTTTPFFQDFALSGEGLRKKLYEQRKKEMEELEAPDIVVDDPVGWVDDGWLIP